MPAQRSRTATTLAIVALLPLVMQLLILVHEGGHALAALAFGGTIQEFHVNVLEGKPRVSYTGLGNTAQAIVTVAGPALPLLLWLAWLLAARGKRSALHSKLLFITGFGALFPVVLWVVFPILHASGRRVREDAIIFIRVSGANPYAVAAVALVMLVGCGWILVRAGARRSPAVTP